jgi:hypothetical protein
MKGTFKALVAGTALATLAGCSTYTTISERDEYAQPKWYAKCAESGSEGWFWWKEDMVYACGAGESRFQQAAEEQMYAIAMNNFAKRVNSTVNSETKLEFYDNNKTTKSVISYVVKDTTIREHLSKETGTYKYQGKFYTFVKLKMNKEVFDTLIQEAKSEKVSSIRPSSN